MLVVASELYLQSTAPGHSLVCVQGGAQLFAEEFADSLFEGGDSGGAAHNLHCIDVFLFQLWTQDAGETREKQSRRVKSHLRFPTL